MNASQKEEDFFMAKISQEVERFDDMLNYVYTMISVQPILNCQERSLLSVAFRNCIAPCRIAYKILPEEQINFKYFGLLKAFKAKILAQLSKYCYDLITVIDNQLIPNANSSEARVFYYKMKGDAFRYIAQFVSGEEKSNSREKSEQAYLLGTGIAQNELKRAHSIRLGLALNYSVFYYEIMNDPSKATDISKKAIMDMDAANNLDEIDQDMQKDVNCILSLLQDNLNLWAPQFQEEEAPL